MDFWHDAAAQKRWLRRFALLIGLLLVPVFALAGHADNQLKFQFSCVF